MEKGNPIFPQELTPKPAPGRRSRLWWQLPVILFGLAFLVYTRLDLPINNPFKHTEPADTVTEALAFPQDIAELQGPTEAAYMLEALQEEFGNQEMQYQMTHAHCGIAFPPEGLRHPRPPRRHEPFCKPEELTPKSFVQSFSPEDFKRAALFLGGPFSRGGQITLSHGHDQANVTVNVTIFAGNDKAFDQVAVSGFDHDGQYAIDVKRKSRGHHGHSKKPPVKEDCVTYSIAIEFPGELTSYDDLDLHIKEVHHIISKDMGELEFGKFRAGVGHGAILLSDIKAKQIRLATLYGVVMGNYHPLEAFTAATVRGATDVVVSPAEGANVTAVTVVGPATAKLPADGFKGNFVVHSWLGTPIVEAPNPADVHVVKNNPTLKCGYYKEADTGSSVIVHSKHGDSELNFQKDDA